jgi:hypothetical protein
MFPVRWELGSYMTKDGIFHSHRRANVQSYTCSSSPLNGSQIQITQILLSIMIHDSRFSIFSLLLWFRFSSFPNFYFTYL